MALPRVYDTGEILELGDSRNGPPLMETSWTAEFSERNKPPSHLQCAKFQGGLKWSLEPEGAWRMQSTMKPFFSRIPPEQISQVNFRIRPIKINPLSRFPNC
jgi:hypothetical protein